MNKFLLYMIHLMDPLVEQDYIIIYIHTPLNSQHRPSISWLRNAYSIFNRK